MVEVLATSDQRQLLARFIRALDEDRPVVVTDPGWTQPLRDAATTALRHATSSGLLDGGRMALFTSGSAGTPTGVVRTHGSWRASIAALTDLTGLEPDRDVVWTPGPLWSSLSLHAAWHASVAGARTVLADEDPSGATVVHCVPSALGRVLREDLPRLRAVVLAGEPVAARHRTACEARGWQVHEYYGAAELSFVGWSADGLPWRPFPGAEVGVRSGEVWVRSPYLALGYLDGRPGALRTDADGWATVGDHATALHGGFAVTGRGSSAISTGGHTVVAEHVEGVLAAVDGVEGVVVVGTQDERLGEVVTAVVQGPATAPALRAALDRLAPAARPRRWVRVGTLPRTSAGKPDRGRLRTDLADGTLVPGPLR